MKRIALPLFWKFTLAIVAVVFVFGTINVMVVWNHVRSSIEAEVYHHATFLARSSASQAIVPIMHDDKVALQRIIDDVISIDSSIAYAFIEDGTGSILAHSFESTVLRELQFANRLGDGMELRTMHITSLEHDGLILDVAVPILSQSVGTMRVAFYEDAITKSAGLLLQWLLLMIGIFLIAGILGAFIFSRVITKPIEAVVGVAKEIAHAPARGERLPRIAIPEPFPGTQLLKLHFPDELDELISHLNEMIVRLEEALNQLRSTQASLLQSEKLAAIGTLASGLAHEINNPLAGMQNCIRRVQRNPAGVEKNAQYLTLALTAAEQIQHIVEGLLDFSRKQTFVLQPVRMNDVVASVIDLTAYRLKAERIAVDTDTVTVLPQVNGSVNHLKQVLLNLIVNSIDAIVMKRIRDNAYTGSIAITTAVDDGMLQLTVHDDGIGIPAEHLVNVFDPFFTTKDVGKGTGLGLAVSYHVIKDHGGDLRVESMDGSYTAFTISLPLY